VLASPKEFATNFYGDILPPQCKIDRIDKDVLEKMINRQKVLVSQVRKHRLNIDIGSSLILDDSVPDLLEMKYDKNKHFKFLFTCGKESGINLIFTSGCPLKIPDYYNNKLDYIFLLKDTNKQNIKKYFNQYGGMFGDFDRFHTVYNQVTEKFGCLVYDRTNNGSKISDHYFWYKAPRRLDEAYLGSKKLWEVCLKSKVALKDLLVKPMIMFQGRR
jgi:hypothetical protein